jgi:hypothetical protein
MTTDPADRRFREIAGRKLDDVLTVYGDLPAEADSPGDKALHLRHAAAKTVLTHIALLRKLLGHDRGGAASETESDLIDADGLQAMIVAAKTPLTGSADE